MSSSGRRSGAIDRVLVDTNGWFLPFRAGTRLEEELGRLLPGARWVTTTSVIDELRELVRRATPHAGAALALARTAEVLPARAPGDEGVVESAVRERIPVLTSDRELTDRLREAGIPVLRPRDRTRLELVPARAARPRSATVISRSPVEPARPRGRGRR